MILFPVLFAWSPCSLFQSWTNSLFTKPPFGKKLFFWPADPQWKKRGHLCCFAIVKSCYITISKFHIFLKKWLSIFLFQKMFEIPNLKKNNLSGSKYSAKRPLDCRGWCSAWPRPCSSPTAFPVGGRIYRRSSRQRSKCIPSSPATGMIHSSHIIANLIKLIPSILVNLVFFNPIFLQKLNLWSGQ